MCINLLFANTQFKEAQCTVRTVILKTQKNGSIHNGKAKNMCKECGRQFVENPQNKIIPLETCELVDKLLLEKILMAGISRVTGISKPWLQKYINEKYENIPKKIDIVKEKGSLTIQRDEMWSFVGSKENKYWIWLAIDQDFKVIVGVSVGSRDRKGALGLWDSLPPVYRQCAVCHTDFRSAYELISPSKRHKAVGKKLTKLVI
jgi:IS1 family transposase